MIGLYFSGTGNTKHGIERFLHGLNGGAELFPLESTEAAEAVKRADEIVFAYPVYYSNLPKIVRDFIVVNAEIWQGKRVFIIATMGMFSGDGAGCAARLFKKYGAKVTGGLHLKMSDCIGDVKLLKKSRDKNRELIKRADEKIDRAVAKIKSGKYPKNGLGFLPHMAGLFGQRLYFAGKTKKYFDRVKADENKCVACGLCASVCPMRNVEIEGGRAKFNGMPVKGLSPVSVYSDYESDEKGKYNLTITTVTVAFFAKMEQAVAQGKYIKIDESGDTIAECANKAWSKAWQRTAEGALNRAFTVDYESTVPAEYTKDGKAHCYLYLAVKGE